jgi:hypothetical protein
MNLFLRSLKWILVGLEEILSIIITLYLLLLLSITANFLEFSIEKT